jgi:hypothetical protein
VGAIAGCLWGCACLVASCQHPVPQARSHERRVLTPEAVGALPIASVEAFPSEQRDLIRAASAELLRTRQQPAEFYGTVGRGKDGPKVDLWHQTAFLPENRAIAGNPGGRCFTIYFDRDGRVAKKLKWQ